MSYPDAPPWTLDNMDLDRTELARIQHHWAATASAARLFLR